MLQTDGIHMAHSLVSRGIRFRKYGVAFVCTPRIGKTWAIDALIAMLKVDNPNMPVFSTEAMQHDDPTEKALWTDILSSVGHLKGGTAAEQKAVLRDLIVSSAQMHDEKLVVMFVDEAQNWGSRHWRYIKGLVNLLRNRPYRIRVLVVSFGQSHLLRVREEITTLSDGGEDLLARFLRNIQEFPAIQNADELKGILAQMDDPELTEYPDHSGVCYTRFFMPLAYAAGWRLESHYKDIWKAFGAVRKNKGQVTMLHLMNLLRELFFTGQDGAEFTVSLPMWKKALSETYEEQDA